MKKKYIMQKHDTDCLQATLSNLLGIDYDDIPKFYKTYKVDGAFRKALRNWVRKLGLVRLVVWARVNDNVLDLSLLTSEDVLCVFVLQKSGREHSHAVLGRVMPNRLEIVHDPKQDTEYGLEDLVQIEFYFNKQKES